MREGNEKFAFIVHLIIRRIPAHFCETQIDQIVLIPPETLNKNFLKKLCFAFNTFNSYAQDWKNQSTGRLIFMPHGKGRQMMLHHQQVFLYSSHQKHYLCLWGAVHVIREKRKERVNDEFLPHALITLNFFGWQTESACGSSICLFQQG